MKKPVYKVGEKVKANSFIKYEGIVIPPEEYSITSILQDGKENVTHYGIVSETPKMDWGDLSGTCMPGHGIWIPTNLMYKYFAPPEFGKKMFIKDEFIFKRRNLKDKECRLISGLPHSDIAFVELDEDVDGCSADGLGKAGHCVLISRKHLKKRG